jgi:hypothetical protein
MLDTYFQNVINQNVNSLTSKWVVDFNTIANSYFLANPHPTSLQVSTVNPKKDYTIDMSFWSNPLFDLTREGVIYYFNGIANTTLAQPSKGFLKKEPVKIGKWDDFNQIDGNYQIFFSANFFGSIINKIANEHSFNITLNSYNLPFSLPYRLDIGSLALVYPLILKAHPSDAAIYINTTLIQSNFTQQGHTPNGQVSFIFTIYLESSNEVLLQWSSVLGFTAQYTYINQIVNVNIQHSLELIQITLIDDPYGTVDVNGLGNWIESTFGLLADWPVLSGGVDLNILFRSSDKNIIADNGLLIFGTSKKSFDEKAFKSGLEKQKLNI